MRWTFSFIRIAFVIGHLALPLALVSCGDSDTSVTVEQPGTVPSPSPSLSPSPSPTQPLGQLWQGVRYIKDCPFPECPARDGFEVKTDGSYFFGPAANPLSTGTITSADLLTLSTAADAVAKQDLSGNLVCQAIEPMPGMSSVILNVNLTETAGSGGPEPITVYSVSTSDAQECLRGDRNLAITLESTMDQLASTYQGQ